MADSAGLPAQSILLEQLVLPTIHAILYKPCRVSRLGLDLGIGRFTCPRFLLRYRLCQPLKVFFAELELPHRNPVT